MALVECNVHETLTQLLGSNGVFNPNLQNLFPINCVIIFHFMYLSACSMPPPLSDPSVLPLVLVAQIGFAAHRLVQRPDLPTR